MREGAMGAILSTDGLSEEMLLSHCYGNQHMPAGDVPAAFAQGPDS
jgi:hypothetical protein